jgi:hypothetical protein
MHVSGLADEDGCRYILAPIGQQLLARERQ